MQPIHDTISAYKEELQTVRGQPRILQGGQSKISFFLLFYNNFFLSCEMSMQNNFNILQWPSPLCDSASKAKQRLARSFLPSQLSGCM